MCKIARETSYFKRERDRTSTLCINCHRVYMKAYSRKKYASPIGRAKQLLGNVKQRAKKKNEDVGLSLEHIFVLVTIGKCQKTGLPFNLHTPDNTHFNPFAPSVDRIDNSRGYTFDNIQLVCNMYNMGKSDNKEIDFIAMCCAVAERHASDPAVIQRLKEIRNAEF